MDQTPLTPEDMAAVYPDLFRTSQRKVVMPLSTFAEQHAFASVRASRQPQPPAACSLLAARMGTGSASHT